MKKLFFVAAMVLASAAAFAQHSVGSLTIQPKIGMNIASLTEAEGSDPRIGLAVGAELEYQAADIFSISVGAIYSMQGCKYNDIIGGPSTSETIKHDYINFPILANVYLTKGLAVKCGVQPGVNVNGDDAKDFDFTIPVGLSYEYSNLVFDARYNFGTTKVYDYADSKNSVFQITVGYKFDL